jgi:hypothetical protein
LESTTYTVDGKEFELKHYGVKGMKWGRRKAPPQQTGTGRRGRQAGADSPEAQAAAKEARRQKVKRAATIGAAAVGTALAAYGTYKLVKMYKSKQRAKGLAATQRMMQQEQDAFLEATRRALENDPHVKSVKISAANNLVRTDYSSNKNGSSYLRQIRDFGYDDKW